MESGPAPPSPPQPGALVWPTPLSLGPQPVATSSLGRAGAPLSLEPPQSTGHPHGPEHTTLPHPPRHPLVHRPPAQLCTHDALRWPDRHREDQWMEGRKEEGMDGWVHGRMDAQVDRQMGGQIGG